MSRLFCAFLLLLPLSACAPLSLGAGSAAVEPRLFEDRIRMADGAELPLARFLPEEKPRAILLSLHGFNDYRLTFEAPARTLARHGIAVYAYDQRGFGQAPNRGLWPGKKTLTGDARTAAALLHEAYPETPLYLLGESMGGAVLLAALAEAPLEADGIVLTSPALRARETMRFYEPALLWLAAHTLPWAKLSGRGLDIPPSDNIEMLKALGRDPNVIKKSRVDALWGLVNLMDDALAAADRLKGPALILYGEKDEIVPKEAFRVMVARLPRPRPNDVRIAVYEKGYHLLLRDLQAKTVLEDLASWILAEETPLPSGAEEVARAWLLTERGRADRFAAASPLE